MISSHKGKWINSPGIHTATFYVNLTWVESFGKITSIDKMPLPDWPTVKPVVCFFN